jgi:hypothetical protein
MQTQDKQPATSTTFRPRMSRPDYYYGRFTSIHKFDGGALMTIDVASLAECTLYKRSTGDDNTNDVVVGT